MSDKKGKVDYEAEPEKRNRIIRAALVYASVYSNQILEAERFGLKPTSELIHQQFKVLTTLKALYNAIIDYSNTVGLTPPDMMKEAQLYQKEDSPVMSGTSLTQANPQKIIEEILKNGNISDIISQKDGNIFDIISQFAEEQNIKPPAGSPQAAIDDLLNKVQQNVGKDSSGNSESS